MVEELWPGGPLFRNDDGIFRPGMDSVVLAYFANSALLRNTFPRRQDSSASTTEDMLDYSLQSSAAASREGIKNRAVDLGCGSGIISVLLAWNAPGLQIDGIELQPKAAELAIENSILSGLSDRLRIITGDLRNHRDFLRAGYYDFSVSNPPYYSQGSGKPPSNKEIAAARSEDSCTLNDICKAAGYLTRWGGSFFLVHKPERLADVFRALSDSCFEPKRLRFVQHNYSSPPSLVLIESRRGGHPALNVEPPVILTNEDGSESGEAKAIYKR